MRSVTSFLIAGALAAGVVASPAVANADPDTDFANALHTIGVYGPKDYNAWIGKIACERLDRGLDHDAKDSAKFVSMQLKGGTTEQAWRFLDLSYATYCPERHDLLTQAADTRPNS